MVASGDTIKGRARARKIRRLGNRWRLWDLDQVLLLLALACALPAIAADRLDIAATVGFTDTFRPGHWAPLIVTVTNHGPDLSGELEVQVRGGNELRGRPFVSSHRRMLELQRGSRKTLQFTVFPQGLFHPLVIRVHSGGRELARSEVDLRSRFVASERLVLVLSRDANLDYLNNRDENGLRVLYPHPELLPVHWRGYDAVAVVVVHGVSLERLSATQFDALRKWIAQGGILAVSGGPEYTLLRTPRLASLLPGLPVGMARLDADVLRSAFPATLDASRAVHVHRLGTFRGHERLRAGDVALIVERALGLGRVLYLTLDVASYPFDRWQGMRELLLSHLSLPPSAASPPNVGDLVLEGPIPALIRADSADFPSYVAVLLFLLLYLGLLATGYQLSAHGRLQKLEPVWSWAAPGLFALVAWLLFGSPAFPRGPSAIVVAVIEPFPDSSYARLELELGMYANRSGALHMEYRGAEPVLYPRQPTRGGHVPDWVFGEGPRPYLEPQDMRRYVLHALQGEDVIAFDLKASVYDEAGGPRLVLENASGRTLEDLRLLFDGHIYDLGTIAASARSERRLARRADGIEAGTATWRDLLKPTGTAALRDLEPARIVLERRSKASGKNEYPGAGYALLVGYSASPLRPAGASAGWSRRERALVALRVPALPIASSGGSEARPLHQGDGNPVSPASPGTRRVAAHAFSAQRND